MIVGKVADCPCKESSGAATVIRRNAEPSGGAGWLCENTYGSPQRTTNAIRSIAANSNANQITVTYLVGFNNRPGTANPANWNCKEIGSRGPNTPVLSGHPAGAMAGFLDGHVHCLPNRLSGMFEATRHSR